MRLDLNLGYHVGRGDPAGHLALTRAAEGLGLRAVWVAEAYGSDAPTTLAWLAAHTDRIELGTAVMQIPGRSPAMAAMTAASLDMLSGGRLRLGLGVSGPQVSEGWHGVPFSRPLLRTREYVDIVRRVLRRETVQHDGEVYRLPLPDGPGKPLRLALRPPRDDVPVYLGAVGPRNLELAGEIADGWLGVFFAPERAAAQLERLAAGRARRALDLTGFDVVPTVPVAVGDDVAACADAVRGYAALYVGGMGSREENYYNRLAADLGFAEAAERVQDLYLSGRQREAAAALPVEFLDATSLLGPPHRIGRQLTALAAAGVSTVSLLLLDPDPDRRLRTLEQVVDAARDAGIGP